ncbi:MAG: Nif3-like dinuclear metal center hexameric protein [Thermodesulfobacteriota bacterium]
MTLLIEQLLRVLDDFAPFALAADWDNVGLQIGNRATRVSGICVALDPSLAVLAEAVEHDCNTIITHHPLLFHPLSQIDTATPGGAMVQKALAADLQIIACHTNLDVVPGGVSDVLARELGLTACRPLQPHRDDSLCGFGRLGQLSPPLAGQDFLARVAKLLAQPEMTVAGPVPDRLERVAVCGGSCGELAELAWQEGAQLMVTAEVKHSQARWAEEAGICLVDCGHFATEQPIVAPLVARLQALYGRDMPVRGVAGQAKPLRGWSAGT